MTIDAVLRRNAESRTATDGRAECSCPIRKERELAVPNVRSGNGKLLRLTRTRYWSFLLKLAKSRPAWTIQAQPGPATGPFHWTNRKLSAQELCRLQTFPEKLQFDCGRNDVQRMLGNAVPSLAAEVIAREIREQLLSKPLRMGKPRLLPQRREPMPGPEHILEVPGIYHALVGDHADHPGEGLGNRARQRAAA